MTSYPVMCCTYERIFNTSQNICYTYIYAESKEIRMRQHGRILEYY